MGVREVRHLLTTGWKNLNPRIGSTIVDEFFQPIADLAGLMRCSWAMNAFLGSVRGMTVRLAWGLVFFYPPGAKSSLFAIPTGRFDKTTLEAVAKGSVYADIGVPDLGSVRLVSLIGQDGAVLFRDRVRLSDLDFDKSFQPGAHHTNRSRKRLT